MNVARETGHMEPISFDALAAAAFGVEVSDVTQAKRWPRSDRYTQRRLRWLRHITFSPGGRPAYKRNVSRYGR